MRPAFMSKTSVATGDPDSRLIVSAPSSLMYQRRCRTISKTAGSSRSPIPLWVTDTRSALQRGGVVLLGELCRLRSLVADPAVGRQDEVLDLVQADDRAEVDVDLGQGVLVEALARAGDAVAQDDDVHVAVVAVADRRLDAEVRVAA